MLNNSTLSSYYNERTNSSDSENAKNQGNYHQIFGSKKSLFLLVICSVTFGRVRRTKVKTRVSRKGVVVFIVDIANSRLPFIARPPYLLRDIISVVSVLWR